MASTHPNRGIADQRRSGPPRVAVPVALGVIGIVVALVIVAIITSRWVIVAALGILLGVLVIGLGGAALIARNAVTHDEARVEAGPAAATSAEPAPEEPTVHDLPLGFPGRAEAEAEAEQRDV